MLFELTHEDGVFLVKLARKAVEEYLKSRKTLSLPKNTPRALMEHCGVFVTLNSLRQEKKQLRGCIGFLYPTETLAKAVIESAINSATRDPRFLSVSLPELDTIVFELSILTPPQLIEVEKNLDYPSKIRVGQDGLIIERGFSKGLLLPQVPIEWKWDEEEFLCQCCLKAGLSMDSWLLKGVKVYNFSCIIVREIAPKGKIVIEDLCKRPDKV